MPDKIKVSSLEYPILLHCNLRCEHCNHLAPYLPKRYVSEDTFCSDVDHASKLFSAEGLYLLGGEPTLHPALDALVQYAADRFPTWLVTNGLNILKIKPATLRSLSGIRVSIYPEIGIDYQSILFELQTILHGTDCCIEITQRDYFYNQWASPILEGNAFIDMYNTCLVQHVWKCYTIYEGRFFKCAVVHVAHKHAERINYPIRDFSSDGLLLGDPDFHSKYADYISPKNILEACRICNGTPPTGHQHRQLV